MTVAENSHTTLERSLARTKAMQRAAELVTQPVLAARMGVPERTLRSYVSVERGLPMIAMQQAAYALERRAVELAEHAAVLRGLAK